MFLTIAAPVYNEQKYLDRCIRSVIEQTDDDYELLLVNDGSKDESLEICRRWCDEYPDKRIRCIDSRNRGSLLTRRLCLENALGEYALIIDGDDHLVSPDAVSEIKKAIRQTDADFLIFNYTQNEDTLEPAAVYPFPELQVLEGDDLRIMYDFIIATKEMNTLWNKVYKKSIVDLNEDYSAYEDICIGTDLFQILPILQNAKRIAYLDRVFYFYRKTEGSIVHRFDPRLPKSVRIDQERLDHYAEKWKGSVENLEQKLSTRYMIGVSTTAFKARWADNIKERKNFLKSLGEDSLFRKKYKTADFSELTFVRKVLLYLLYHKKYTLLASALTVLHYD